MGHGSLKYLWVWLSLILSVNGLISSTNGSDLSIFERHSSTLMEQKTTRMKWALQFAPIIFQESFYEDYRAETGFNPIDHPVSLEFEEDSDFSNNGERILRLTNRQEETLLAQPILYFSVMESESHLYLHYMIYRALDQGPNPHTHDTENILTIVNKRSEQIEAVLTNAHGLAQVYSSNSSYQRQMRMRLPADGRRRYLHLLDPTGILHHDTGPVQFQQDGKNIHPYLFSCARTHAIYKLNRSLVNEDFSEKPGTYLIPRSCAGECSIFNHPDRVYTLVDFDLWMHGKITSLLSKTISLDDWKRMFVVEKSTLPWFSDPEKRENESAIAKVLPRYPAQAPLEENPEAGFYYDAGMSFPYTMMEPQKKHSYLDPFNREISLRIINHPYAGPASPSGRSQSFSLWRLWKSLTIATHDVGG